MSKSYRIMPRAIAVAAVLAAALCGCVPVYPPAPYGGPVYPPAPYSQAPGLPYAACGDMTSLRANLTGNSAVTPQSDALLGYLGVRCIGEGAPAVRARY
jgi:hypothetical protein